MKNNTEYFQTSIETSISDLEKYNVQIDKGSTPEDTNVFNI